jgi:hypothetical protein
VAIIAPFNFPLEIPVLQLMGALYMGNKPLLHVDQVYAAPFPVQEEAGHAGHSWSHNGNSCFLLFLLFYFPSSLRISCAPHDAEYFLPIFLPERLGISDVPPSTHVQTGHWLQRVSMVMDQFMRLLHECGLPKTDVDVLNCQGPVMNEVLVKAKPHMTLFTGSSRIAEKLALDLSGKVCVDCGLPSGRRAIGPRLPYQPIESWKKPGGGGHLCCKMWGWTTDPMGFISQ